MPARIVNGFRNVNLKVGETDTPFVDIDDDITKITVTISRANFGDLQKVPDTLIVYMDISHDGGATILQTKRVGIEGSDLTSSFGIAPFSYGNLNLLEGTNRVGRLRAVATTRFRFTIDIDMKTGN